MAAEAASADQVTSDQVEEEFDASLYDEDHLPEGEEQILKVLSEYRIEDLSTASVIKELDIRGPLVDGRHQFCGPNWIDLEGRATTRFKKKRIASANGAPQWMWQNFLRAARQATPGWIEPIEPRPARKLRSKRKRAGEDEEEDSDDADGSEDAELKASSKWSITNTIVMMSIASDEGAAHCVLHCVLYSDCSCVQQIWQHGQGWRRHGTRARSLYTSTPGNIHSRLSCNNTAV